ncbi:hypothetical protein [Streptomyces sp. DH37]|uniref:hypothetical protein n=1 Tax=Streptomyces sp. DH37 TaxID=3040122 RepID=UPI0024430F5B|nr:hypothetical protein [Streptomyces sp. DH37]MDG9703762.1 hypothetical protein [Streptomyces sp. DH37]
MTLPEYELYARCRHGIEIQQCTTAECSDELSQREDDYARERLAHAHETGEYHRL